MAHTRARVRLGGNGTDADHRHRSPNLHPSRQHGRFALPNVHSLNRVGGTDRGAHTEYAPCSRRPRVDNALSRNDIEATGRAHSALLKGAQDYGSNTTDATQLRSDIIALQRFRQQHGTARRRCRVSLPRRRAGRPFHRRSKISLFRRKPRPTVWISLYSLAILYKADGT